MQEESRPYQSLTAFRVCTPASCYLCSGAFQTHPTPAFRHVSWDPGIPVGCSQRISEVVIRRGHPWRGGVCVTLQSLAHGLRGAILTGIHLPELHSLASHMQPKLCLCRTGKVACVLPVLFFLFREALQILGLLICIRNSFCQAVIPKEQHRASRLFKKQNGTRDKQSKTSELRCPKCQAEPGYSTFLSDATISTSTVCSACSSMML